MEDFKTYISHYKAAQEETANFLSYYDTKVTFLIVHHLSFLLSAVLERVASVGGERH